MCGRFVITSPPAALRQIFGYPEQPNFPPRFNIAPTQPIPVVIIENGSGSALRLNMKVQFVDPENHHLDPYPPDDLIYYQGVKKPPHIGPATSLPIPLPRRQKKGPLNTPEITNRALSVKLIPNGESAYGFFYFEAEHQPGSMLYLNGLSSASSGKEYFYFDLPLESK